MAGIVAVKGFEDLRRNTEALSKAIVDEAIIAAEDAAAAVIKEAVEGAAPHSSGQLRASIKIFVGTIRGALTGSNRRRLLVGPDKAKGFYGYFLEKGWTATGRKRRARAARGSTHGQSGTTGGRKVVGRPWFSEVSATVEERASKAGADAFDAVIKKHSERA